MTMITRPKTSAMPTVPRAPSYCAFAITAPHPANTRANAARPSARARRAMSGRATAALLRDELGEQRSDAFGDLVADAPHGLGILAGRVLEVPVLIALARIDRACIPAAHGDHDVGGLHALIGERLRELP